MAGDADALLRHVLKAFSPDGTMLWSRPLVGRLSRNSGVLAFYPQAPDRIPAEGTLQLETQFPVEVVDIVSFGTATQGRVLGTLCYAQQVWASLSCLTATSSILTAASEGSSLQLIGWPERQPTWLVEPATVGSLNRAQLSHERKSSAHAAVLVDVPLPRCHELVFVSGCRFGHWGYRASATGMTVWNVVLPAHGVL